LIDKRGKYILGGYVHRPPRGPTKKERDKMMTHNKFNHKRTKRTVKHKSGHQYKHLLVHKSKT